MHNLLTVVSREYVTRVRKRSFLIITILFPFLMAAVVAVPIGLAAMQGGAEKTVAVIDSTGRYAPLFYATPPDSADGCRFVPAVHPLQYYRSDDAAEDAVVAITADPALRAGAVKVYSRGELTPATHVTVRQIIEPQVRRDRLRLSGVAQLDSIISAVERGVSVETVRWGDDGEERSSAIEVAMVAGMFAALMIYMFVMYYGGLVMSSVMEEKQSRVVEVIISSVRPFTLMMGKLLAVMLMGLTQLAVWALMAVSASLLVGSAAVAQVVVGGDSPALSATQAGTTDTAALAQEVLSNIGQLPLVEMSLLFVLLFLGGYLLNASFYAAIGAAVNSQEDSTQFLMPMMLIMIFALYAAMASMQSPDGPLAFWASLFPLTSPVVMMLRLPFGVPLWQEALCIALLYAAALAMVWAAARIYRVGILMYGKKPTVAELWRWMRA